MWQDRNRAGKLTKGERTAQRIMDVAEELFATRGYDGTSLRQIAEGAGIREPGLYNHFSGKQALYDAVLQRALRPMAETFTGRLNEASVLRDYTDLPALLTDMLLAHPHMAALLQQVLQGDGSSAGYRVIQDWLASIFEHSVKDMGAMGTAGDSNREGLVINLIAMFNLTTGYFLSQGVFNSLTGSDTKDPANIERQKKLLHKVVRAMLIS